MERVRERSPKGHSGLSPARRRYGKMHAEWKRCKHGSLVAVSPTQMSSRQIEHSTVVT